MTDKDLREIRRRFRPDKNNILSIKGCLVNGEKAIVSRFDQPMATCSAEETEKLLATMKKTLSGSLGANLLELAFSAKQVMDSDEHRLLTALRTSGLKDEGAVEELFRRVIEAVRFDGNFAVLLASDTYDVFTYSADGEREDSSTVFSYIVCCVCPVKPLNAGLYYREYDSSFRSIESFAMLGAPEVGFMFPAFDDRAANISGALLYTRDVSDVHPAFVDRLFRVEQPMSVTDQRDTFDGCLKETLEEECDFEVLRSVHDQIAELVEEHKQTRQPEPLRLSKGKLKTVLEGCGVAQERVDRFGERFDEEFGADAQIPPKGIVDVKKFELVTPDVSIKVNPERTDLVSTQIINGVKYILIRAGEGVEVNGINVDIQ